MCTLLLSQEHYFLNPEPGKLVAKINWRISTPGGGFLPRSTLQKFVVQQPGVLYNGGNEYLHYQDTWCAKSNK